MEYLGKEKVVEILDRIDKLQPELTVVAHPVIRRSSKPQHEEVHFESSEGIHGNLCYWLYASYVQGVIKIYQIDSDTNETITICDGIVSPGESGQLMLFHRYIEKIINYIGN